MPRRRKTRRSARRVRRPRRVRRRLSVFQLLRKSLRTRRGETPKQHKRRVQEELQEAHERYCK